MIIHIKIIGAVLVVLALSHAIFPKYFNWREQLKPLSMINRQMMTIHTFFIALAVLLLGLLCLTSAGELMHTPLGRRVSFGMGIFWVFRFFIQFFGYSAELWKGKRFETIIHVLFAGLFGYMSVVFFAVAFMP